jgi:hypothetical protein
MSSGRITTKITIKITTKDPRSPALVSAEVRVRPSLSLNAYVFPDVPALLALSNNQQADPGFVAIFAPGSPRAC